MQTHSVNGIATNGAKVEIATIAHEGRSFSNLGSVVDEKAGLVVGYVKEIDNAQGVAGCKGWILTTWEGQKIADLKRTGRWRHLTSPFGAMMESFRMSLNGRTYSGRKGDMDLIRMRAR